jgi:mono/diheme cytochrome c family protein
LAVEGWPRYAARDTLLASPRQTRIMPSSRRFSSIWIRVALGAVAVLVLTACGSSTDTGDKGISPQDPGLVAEGAGMYQASCASCHGGDLRGTDRGPSFLSIVYEPGHHSDVAFLFAVQRGTNAHHWRFGDMPRIDGVTPEDVDAIVAFVRETQRVEGFDP